MDANRSGASRLELFFLALKFTATIAGAVAPLAAVVLLACSS